MPDHPKAHIQHQSYRIIPSHYPPIQLFEDLLDPEELEVAYLLEGLTNDRLQDQVGNIHMVGPEDRVVGNGTTPIMAAFTHIGVPSRFSNGDFGVYYAGLSLETAVVESMESQRRRLAATHEGPQVVAMRTYKAMVDAELVDIRGIEHYHRADSWVEGQGLGMQVKAANDMGIVYDSVRQPGGTCIAAFRPAAIVPPAHQTVHFEYHWDGGRFTHYSKIVSEVP